MRFKQISHLISYLITLHQTLKNTYRRWEEICQLERSQLLLQFMQQREEQTGQHLQDFMDNASDAVLDTWLEQAFDADPLQLFASLPSNPELSCDEIISLATDVEECLIGELRSLRNEMPSEATRDALDNILHQEINRQHQLVHSAHRLDDV